MDTTEKRQPTFNITKEEAEKIRADFYKARIECAEKSAETMKQEIEWIDQILQDIQQEDVTFDELIIPLHNLISIAPECQAKFLTSIRELYKSLPREVKEDADAKYARKRLREMKAKELEVKIQTTDLSMYWSRYRVLLQKYWLFDTDEQIAIQEKMKKDMLQIAVNIVAKRTRGIESAKRILEHK